MNNTQAGYGLRIGAAMLLAGAMAAGAWWALPATGQVSSDRGGQAYVGTGYELSRYTVDDGGVIFATSDDGRYELSGTIGQPDAGGPITGPPESGYELTGGFWFALAPGDCNSDAGVNLFDHRDFAACMAGPDAGPLSPQCRCFDLDGSGRVDLADFARLASGFSGS